MNGLMAQCVHANVKPLSGYTGGVKHPIDRKIYIFPQGKSKQEGKENDILIKFPWKLH